MTQIKKIGIITVAIGITGTMVISCSKSPSTGNSSSLFGSFDQTAMLTNIANNVLLTQIDSLAFYANAVNTDVTSFTANPSTATLNTAQSDFAKLATNWGLAVPYNFGPMQTNSLQYPIDTYPWPANTTKIETEVSGQGNAATAGTDVEGMKSLEYLLFDKSGNAAVLTKYTTASDAANRKKYLISVATDLQTKTASLKSGWTNYLSSFVGAKGNDVNSSLSLIINNMSIYLDVVKNMKIGNPIGMGVKLNDNKVHPDQIEYPLSEESLPVMIANMQSMKDVFDGGSGQGIDDLLNYLKAQSNGQNLSTVIDNQFNDAITKLKAINPPYVTAITTQTQQLQAIYTSIKALLAYIKVDMANNLGVTITFTDNDGD
ncbi:MAG TPA: imelysin family protein [Arachidicoccus sp.]